ncbi:MAG: ATPase-like protein [Chthonomonadales bacterium]|nr:ATPase-like protein [Chthonomonadales bacterium]
MTVPTPVFESAPLTITLFGPMQVHVHGRPLPHLRSRKVLWLLALLALRHGRPVEREWLIGALWPDTDRTQALASLSVVLSELRRGLGDQRDRLRSPDRRTLLLDLEGVEVDLVAFDVAIVSKRSEALKQAVALYRGPLLTDCAEEWIWQERQVREQECLRALQTLGDSALTVGDYGGAIDYYRRAVNLDPFQETALRGWMEALAKSGNRNGALQVYREFVALLHGNPGAAADEETSALYHRLRTEVRRQAGPPHAVTTEAAANDADLSVRVSGTLPHPLTDLIGREDEKYEVAAILRSSRLVTLTGPGGVGKTRLALEIANESVHDSALYPDGVWLVSLESLAEGRLISAQIAAGLGLREGSGRNLMESLTDHLRTKRLLLVLDNCEHLLAASAEVTAHLLRECPQIRILVTSRETLGMMGETIWQVPSLATPDLAHLPSGRATLLRVLMGYESVQLFVQRAQTCRQDFVLTDRNATATAQICAQLEGVPLAIELAASRIKALTVEQIAARLNDRLELLTSGNRTANSRQQTLRATLDWSYALLSAAERLLLERLSVFAGGWTLESAEQIGQETNLKPKQVLNLLTGLLDKSLVVFEQGETGGRYRFLETVRQYASERLQMSGRTGEIRKLHRDWYTRLAEEADRELNGPEQGRWLQRLEREHDNLRAALSWHPEGEEDRETELRLVSSLWQFWDIRGHHTTGRHFLQRALQKPEAEQVTVARARALTGAGALALRQGDLTEARSWHQQSRSVFGRLKDSKGIAASLANEGVVAWTQGDIAEAKALLEESLRLRREAGHQPGIAVALQSLGQLVQWQGDYAKAKSLYEESLSLLMQLGNEIDIAFVLNNIGNLCLLQSDYTTARMWFEESLSLRRKLGDRHGIALATASLGLAAKLLNDYMSAQTLLEEAQTIFKELGDLRGEAMTLSNLGMLMSDQGDQTQAQALLTKGLAIQKEVGDREGIAFTLRCLGTVLTERKEFSASLAALQESLTLSHALESRSGAADSLVGMADLMLEQIRPDTAVTLWGAAQALRETSGAVVSQQEQTRQVARLDQARMILGDNDFDVAWTEGYTLTWDQIVDRALSN